MLPILPVIDEVGFESVDLMGTVQFDVCVRFLHEDPWERVRLVHQAAPHTRFRSLIRSKSIVAFDFLPDDVNELWVERLYANGFRVIGAFDGLNDVDNIIPQLSLAKKLGAYTFGALSFCESPLHTDEHYVKTAKALIDRADVSCIMIKDAGGLLTVDRIRTLVPALRQVVTDRPLELHSHCLTGLAPLVYLEGAKLGCDQLHLSVKPLANGAAQPALRGNRRAREEASRRAGRIRPFPLSAPASRRHAEQFPRTAPRYGAFAQIRRAARGMFACPRGAGLADHDHAVLP